MRNITFSLQNPMKVFDEKLFICKTCHKQRYRNSMSGSLQ